MHLLTHSYSASVIIPQIFSVTTAGRHLTAFPWGFITYTIPVLYYSVVSLFGPALKRDCICIWDRDGAGPVLADSSQQLCSPWARLQLYWVPWKAEGRCPREVGQPHSWGAHSIPAGTQHAFHTLLLLFPGMFSYSYCYSSCVVSLLKLLQLCPFFCRQQWFGAHGCYLPACCCLSDILSSLLVERRDL